MLKIAYICDPHIGGMFSFFLRMRDAFADHGVTFNCVPPTDRNMLSGTPWADIGGMDAPGELTGRIEEDIPRIVMHLSEHGYALVMVLPGSHPLGSLLPFYLPSSIRCMARAPLMTYGVYAPLKAMQHWLNHSVAVIDRIGYDLVRRYGFDDSEVSVIYNGVKPIGICPPKEYPDGMFTVLYAGRIEDQQKNVMLLPGIVEHLLREHRNVYLLVAGDGPDREKLATEFQDRGISDHVEMLGGVDAAQMAVLYRKAHCVVLPSRYEGCPNMILEAMSHGVVPIISKLRYISGVLIEDRVSGYIISGNNARCYAAAIERLMQSPDQFKKMSQAACQHVNRIFNLDDAVQRYVSVFNHVLAEPDKRLPPKDVRNVVVPRVEKNSLRRWLPVPVKLRLRAWAERFGISV